MMVLFAGLGVVFTLFVVCRLFPGKTAVLPSPQVTDDRFVLVVREPGPGANVEAMHGLMRECNAIGVEESEAW
jgi:hypothetical protein